MECFKPLDLIFTLVPDIQCIFYILYPIQVKQQLVKVLIDLNGKVNGMNHNFAKKPELRVCKTKIGTQKINNSNQDIFGKVIAFFSIEDKKKSSYFLRRKSYWLTSAYILLLTFFSLS